MKVPGGRCCPPKSLSNLTFGMHHVLSCAHFLQQTFLLEQLLLAATGTGAPVSCLAAEQVAVQNCHGGTAPLPQKPRARVDNSTPFPLSFQSITTSFSRRYSPRCLHQVSLEVFLWESRLEALALWLVFLCSASVSLAGLWLQPSKLTVLSGRKIREENAFEIPSQPKIYSCH